MNIELVPAGRPSRGTGLTVEWGGSGPDALRTTVDAWFSKWGPVSPRAVGMARIGTAVFLADRMVRRPARTLSRRLDLTVHVPGAGALVAAVEPLCELLHWVTGDNWTIELVNDPTKAPKVAAVRTRDRVGLLSGGLDSFCGAVKSHTDNIVYLGHGDASNVRTAQDDVVKWFAGSGVDLDMEDVWLLPPTRTGKEPTRRSRAIFFVLLAVALADGSGASEIEIPENGFTSLNPPLGPNRGGVWTTRSTHPRTLELFGEVFAAAGLSSTLVNPYESFTKGELVAAASEAAKAAKLKRFEDGVAATQSCAKADGRFFGGSPMSNCGLCFACVVRRGGVLGAMGRDKTKYLVDTLAGTGRTDLVARRWPDTHAITSVVTRGVTPARLLAVGPFGTMSFSDATDLCSRSLKELALVPLP